MAGLLESARPMLLALNESDEAAPFLAAYDMRVQFTPQHCEPFHMAISGGKVRAVRPGPAPAFSIRDDLELRDAEDGLRQVLEGTTSPARAMYYGRLTPRGERAKHCQAAVVMTLLRIAQDGAERASRQR